MNEMQFINSYADKHLIGWWDLVAEVEQQRLLVLLTGLRNTPLAELDQFTVSLHTGREDAWQGPRIVFGIRNNTRPGGRATPHSNCLSIGLKPGGITVSVNYSPGLGIPSSVSRASDIFNYLVENKAAVQGVVDSLVQLRKINGRSKPFRRAYVPKDYP